MPESSENAYGLLFEADVSDFATKAQQVTEQMNKLADATERVQKAGKGGPASPYVQQIKEAQRELAATEKIAGGSAGNPYWADAIRRQKAVVEDLRKKDRAEEEQKFKSEQEQDKRKESFRERLTRYRAGLESTLFKKVEKDRDATEDKILKKQKLRHDREQNFVRGVSQVAGRMRQGLSYVGLGGVGQALEHGAVSGASAAVAGGMGVSGGLALGGIGALGAAGVAGVGGLMWSARQGMHRNPALQSDIEMARYVNPVEAMEKTRTIAKLEAETERLKTRWYMKSAEWVGDVLLKGAVSGAKALGTSAGTKAMAPWAQTMIESTQSPGQKATEKAVESAIDAWAKGVKDDPTLGELRHWISQGRGALGNTGPKSQWAQMGLYATSSEAMMVNRQDLTQVEMVSAMKDMTMAMKQLTEKGILADLGAGNSSLGR